jgi:2-polyprenyl-3-methyl-5-hydroxy-6-metoxy-1,4-benzoquinol methylase
MSVEQSVRSHFHADAQRFDAIYTDRKGPFSRWVDGYWRGVVRERFELTLRLLEPLAGKTVLDVGCGSGRYCLAYAHRGAARVVGVDFAPAMIELASDHARREGVADLCEFRAETFPGADLGGPFDYSTAMGFFDYTPEPIPLIARMRALTRERLVMSFPKAREWRAPLRRLRFWLNGCSLFLYSEKRVRTILAEAGIAQYEWLPLDRDYIVFVRE